MKLQFKKKQFTAKQNQFFKQLKYNLYYLILKSNNIYQKTNRRQEDTSDLDILLQNNCKIILKII